MDAPEPELEIKRGSRPLVARLVVAWLAVVIAAGLWQGYGEWLLGGGVVHVR